MIIGAFKTVIDDFTCLVKGIFSDSGKDEQLRKDIAKQAKHKGKEYLYEQLKQVDPEAAEKIHPNDLRRIIRGLEVYEVNKRTISDLKTEIKGLDETYDIKIFAIERERKELYRRIEQRVDKMFDAGCIDEVKALLKSQLSHTAMQALGIKQISEYIDNKCSLDQAKELIKRDSRRYAKRQLTWFRAEKNIVWIKVDEQNTAASIASQILSKIGSLSP